MPKHKPDQGTYARTTVFLLLGGLVAFGCVTMYYWLLSFRGAGEEAGLMGRNLSGGPVPVLGLTMTPAFLIATGVGLLGLFGLRRLVDRPKTADLLIDAETEMRKCTWPSPRETVTSSIVILVVMLFFTAVLAGMDFVLNQFMSGVVFG